MPQVDDEIKKIRVHKLLKLSDELELEYYSKFLGEELDVLTEEYEGEYTVGFTSNYIKVYLKGEYKLNQIYTCKLEKINKMNVYASVASCLKEESKI